MDSQLCVSLSVIHSADSYTSDSVPEACFVIFSDLDEDVMLSALNSEELHMGKKEQAAVELPPYSPP